MKTIVFSLLTVALALTTSCSGLIRPASTPDRSGGPATAEERIAALERVTLDLRNQVTELTRTVNLLSKDVTAQRSGIPSRNTGLQPAASGSTPVRPADNRNDPEIDGEIASLQKAQELVNKVRTQSPNEQMLKEINGLSKYAAPLLMQLLKESDEEVRRRAAIGMKALEPRDGVKVLVDNLSNKELRGTILDLLGTIGDSSAGPALLKLLEDPTQQPRLLIAAAAARVRCKQAIPVLVESLRSKEDDKVIIAVKTLMRVTGESFEPSYPYSPEDRDKLAKQWEDWWKKNKDSFAFPQ
jgi:hypothetical protein